MKDVMLDFETFGNGKQACIVQIGACYFNRDTGEIGRTFKANVEAESSVRAGGVIDASTVYWWLQQSPEAIKSITSGPKMPIDIAMEGLNNFLFQSEAIWSHATFDFVILSETLKLLNMKPKFSYRSARDIRTLNDLVPVDYATEKRVGTHHDALDDAIFQVGYVVKALNKLRGKL